MRRSLIDTKESGVYSSYENIVRHDSVKSLSSVLQLDSMLSEIDIKEFSVDARGDTIFPVKSKKITVRQTKKSSVKEEESSSIKSRSDTENRATYSAESSTRSSSNFGSVLRLFLLVLFVLCVLVLLLKRK